MKVLITCGPTWVPLDDVRVISNQSTGVMGQTIAEEFKKSGAKVTLIEGPVTQGWALKGIKVIKYRFFDELAQVLKKECGRSYDVIIHAAAVSDFKPAQTHKGKLESRKTLNIKLVPAPKLINRIKEWAPESCLVGFKLENFKSQADAAKASRKLFREAGCDVVVANSVANGYKAYVFDADEGLLGKATDKRKIAALLVGLL